MRNVKCCAAILLDVNLVRAEPFIRLRGRCSAPYWLEPRSGKFLRYTGTNRLQKGTIRVSVLSSSFRNNCFIPEKIFKRLGQL